MVGAPPQTLADPAILRVLSSECSPAAGIGAAFQFAEVRQDRWQLGRQATSMFLAAEGAISGHDAVDGSSAGTEVPSM
jgi:hypothetical protein